MNKIVTTKERLIEFLSFLNIGQNAFEKKVGIGNGYISNNKGTLGSDIIKKISETYSELNIEWLIKGEGEMLNNNQHLENVKSNVTIGRDANEAEINITCQNLEGFFQVTQKFQEQTDRMLAIIEKLTNN